MIQLSLSADQTLAIETSVVTLRSARPVLNGAVVENYTCEVLQLSSDQIELRYTSPALSGGSFGLKATQPDPQGHSWIQYWVEGLPPNLVLDSFGLCFEQVENLRQYLRNGYEVRIA